MAVEVVDASALGALLFGEPDGAAIAGQLRSGMLGSELVTLDRRLEAASAAGREGRGGLAFERRKRPQDTSHDAPMSQGMERR